MTKERRPVQPKPEDIFGFTEREKLFDRVSHTRLLEIVSDAATTVHKIEESYNNYGGFLFVTVSRSNGERRILVTFWGQGLHEGRERWLMDEWFWYQAHPFPPTLEQRIPNDQARQQIEQHRATISAEAKEEQQTKRGQIFELIADLTDEDGAWAEMQDLPWWLLGDDAE